MAVKSKKKKNSDISNNVVLVVLLFAIMATVLSFAYYFKAIDNAQPVVGTAGIAQVGIGVISSPKISEPIVRGSNIGLTVISQPEVKKESQIFEINEV